MAELKDASINASVQMHLARCVSVGCMQLDASLTRRIQLDASMPDAGQFKKKPNENCEFAKYFDFSIVEMKMYFEKIKNVNMKLLLII